jgi:hypothetical protein
VKGDRGSGCFLLRTRFWFRVPPKSYQGIVGRNVVFDVSDVVSSRFTFRFLAAHENDGTWAMHVVEQRHVDLERQIGTGNTVVGQSRLVLDSVQVQVEHRADANYNMANFVFHALLE